MGHHFRRVHHPLHLLDTNTITMSVTIINNNTILITTTTAIWVKGSVGVKKRRTYGLQITAITIIITTITTKSLELPLSIHLLYNGEGKNDMDNTYHCTNIRRKDPAKYRLLCPTLWDCVWNGTLLYSLGTGN
mmetsp:Transcript_3974/g.8630  ORF Transcript_3974/g.8630 Transcript_3974/m.8630 type:complete len:133 (-) Transcript_3974:18-416(-)